MSQIKVLNQKIGANFAIYNGDSCEITRAIPSNSVHYSIFSPPFSALFVYSSNSNCLGNSKSDGEFFAHFEYLATELNRILIPGRLVSVHCMNLPSKKSIDGFIGLKDFRGDIIRLFQKVGFIFHSEVTIYKDPVVAMQRTKSLRLLHKQLVKDSSMSGQGIADYLITFRKVGINPQKIQGCFDHWVGEGEGPEDKEYDNDYNSRNPYSIHVWQKYASPVWSDIRQGRVLSYREARDEEDERHICVGRGSLVLTKSGYKQIQDVRAGDLVLTHMGRWRPVLAVQNTGVRKTIKINAHGVSGLVLTPDHKLWARKNNWVRERDGAARATPGWLRADEAERSYINLKLPPMEDAKIKDELHWWIVGRWLADGHFTARNQAVISCGSHKFKFFEEKALNYVGFTGIKENCFQINLLDPKRKLRETLFKCGSGAANKHLPPEAFTLPQNLAKSLLDGYLSGDGHLLYERKRWMASSVSKELLLGIAILAQRSYGAIASVYAGRGPRSKEIKGRAIKCAQDWILSFDIPSNSERIKPFILEDGAWKKVRSVEENGEVETWNLRVEEDESFTTEGCIVKNCPLQLDVIERGLELWTNPGDIVFSPFMGIGSEGYCSLLTGRKFIGIELKESYYKQSEYIMDNYKNYEEKELERRAAKKKKQKEGSEGNIKIQQETFDTKLEDALPTMNGEINEPSNVFVEVFHSRDLIENHLKKFVKSEKDGTNKLVIGDKEFANLNYKIDLPAQFFLSMLYKFSKDENNRHQVNLLADGHVPEALKKGIPSRFEIAKIVKDIPFLLNNTIELRQLLAKK